MASIHGHEVLHMILSSKVAFTQRSLIEAIHQRFGEEARFHTCSAENMTAAELVAFLEKKGKFIAVDGGFTTSENKICRH
ncbi:YecH family protein [Proteus mirabilis]|uniref:YecH family metal-binding protein n=1 Tax=Proteus mirabilis TaxID=584 RepID=UPI001F44C9BE|nr:YecH family metal-binding protein [Proteus mirabilis]MCE5371123.1 YecH family protein [Proteus mirabilis]MDL2137563.1 YecH family protein [Proteus mirabilis]